MKQSRKTFRRKIKLTGYIYLIRSQLWESEGRLNLESCLHGDIINYDSSIVNYINKHEIYRQLLLRRVKYTNMNNINN